MGSAEASHQVPLPAKAGILVRVSDPGQHTDNQLPDLVAWAERRGMTVMVTYEFQESAWKGAHQKQLTQVYQDARSGKFQVLLVWALDRLSREGPLATLEIVHRLGQSGVQVWSFQEHWTEAGGELLDLLLAISGWVARMESNRRSERTKAGLNRAKSQGKRLGRPPGSKDRKKRSKRGYLLRYAE